MTKGPYRRQNKPRQHWWHWNKWHYPKVRGPEQFMSAKHLNSHSLEVLEMYRKVGIKD